ncbi:MAG: transposase, partial [Bacteroidota bacterium]
VIMSNHVHLVAQSVSEKQTLPDIIRDFKSFTAKQINKQIQTIKTANGTYLLFGCNDDAMRVYQFSKPKHH